MFSKYAYYHYLPTTASGLKRLGWGNSLQQIPKEKRFFVREGVEWQKPPVLRVFLSKYDMKQILLHFVRLNLLLFSVILVDSVFSQVQRAIPEILSGTASISGPGSVGFLSAVFGDSYVSSYVCMIVQSPSGIITNMAAFTGTKLQRCLSQFGGSALTIKPNKRLLKTMLKPNACMARQLAFNSFPWIQSSSGL